MNNRNIAAVAALLICGLSGAAVRAADQPSEQPADPGLWQKHTYSFMFMGFTSTYSCEGLATKLKLLLLAAGARADSRSVPAGCGSGYGQVDKFASANLTFYTLVPAAYAPSTAEGPSVGGVWRPVTVTRLSPRELELGDCELVEQFKRAVLPQFTTRNVVDRTTCVPHQLSGTTVNLNFETFAIPQSPAKVATNPQP
jgi:hypothetical protein